MIKVLIKTDFSGVFTLSHIVIIMLWVSLSVFVLMNTNSFCYSLLNVPAALPLID